MKQYGFIVEVALGCGASAIIYRKTRIYGDYQLKIGINVSTRQLTLQPIATSSIYSVPIGVGGLHNVRVMPTSQ